MKRLFDIVFSIMGLILTIPIFIVISIIILLESKGGVFFKQKRVGRNNIDFTLYKFRTMYVDSEKKNLLTVGLKDSRITKFGYYLRKYKLDEIPQFINILIGNMSFVGPRPEVRKFVDQYTLEQLKVLNVKPGITDWASIEYVNENELIVNAENPEEYYVKFILPKKNKIARKYLKKNNILVDIKIILKTFMVIFKHD